MAIHQRKVLNIVFTIMTIVGIIGTVVIVWFYIQQNKFNLYEDKGDARFKVKYPKNWTVAPYTNGTHVTFYSPLENALDTFKENINVVVQDMSDQKIVPDLTKYTEIAISQMQTVFKRNFVLQESKPILLDGVPGHQIVFLGRGSETEMKFKCVWAIKGKKAYQMTFGAVASQYDKYIDKIDAMIRSFDIP